MKANKALSLVMLVIILISSFSVETSYSLTIKGYDSSLRNAPTYIHLKDGSRIPVPNGGSVTLPGYIECQVFYRLELGWTRPIPMESERHVEVSLREQAIYLCCAPIVFGRKQIVMVDLMYPYGKPKVYMNGSLVAISAQLSAMGHSVEIVDLNIDDPDDQHTVDKFRRADIVGISVIGSPYIPSCVSLCERLTRISRANIIVGGQVIEAMSDRQFGAIFGHTGAYGPGALPDLLSTNKALMPNSYTVSFVPVYEAIGKERLKKYLEREMALVLSQGCIMNCDFCAARKHTAEFFRDLPVFAENLEYLAKQAKENGLESLEFYASSLDFFQSPNTLPLYLKEVARISKESGVKIKIRCLSTLAFFLKSCREIKGLANMLREAGVWCVGFGVDGTDEKVWRAQNKGHNKTHDVIACLDACQSMDIRAEILLVMGFPEDTPETLAKSVKSSLRYAWHWPHTYLRPYLAKKAVPGNKGWLNNDPIVEACERDNKNFYNLDFCALGSKLTHPDCRHRWLSNLSYLAIIAILSPFGRCCTSPLFPQGKSGFMGKLAALANRFMPFDR